MDQTFLATIMNLKPDQSILKESKRFIRILEIIKLNYSLLRSTCRTLSDKSVGMLLKFAGKR